MAQRGLAELTRLFDTLPAGAEADLKAVLPEAAALILSIQKEDVPIRTGDLWRGLATQTLDDGLKVRAGLLSIEGRGRASLFYGRVIEGGRKAQTVLVQRRRRVGGLLRTRRGRKIAADIVATYRLRVAAEPPRPFVVTPATESAMLGAMEKVADLIEKRMENGA